eukprot:1145757-Pelagomonas_calceolata.AAC.3
MRKLQVFGVYRAPPESHPCVPSMPNQTLAPNKQLLLPRSRYGCALHYIAHSWHRIGGPTFSTLSKRTSKGLAVIAVATHKGLCHPWQSQMMTCCVLHA